MMSSRVVDLQVMQFGGYFSKLIQNIFTHKYNSPPLKNSRHSLFTFFLNFPISPEQILKDQITPKSAHPLTNAHIRLHITQ
jgi:hypothetical protein